MKKYRILVLDFPGNRPEARIESMGLDREACILVDLLESPLPTDTAAESYVARLLARVPQEAGVDAVMGYCSSAALAGECVRQLTWPDRKQPALIVLNPSTVSELDVWEAYVSACTVISGPAVAATAPSELLRDGENAIRVLGSDLRQRASDALRRRGLPTAVVEEASRTSVAMYLDWITHLLVARQSAGRDTGLSDTLRIYSSDHAGAAAEQVDGLARVVGCDSRDFLTAAETRDAVLTFLRSRPRAAPR